MTISESKGRFFLQNESIRIDSHNESNRIDSNPELECSNIHARRRQSFSFPKSTSSQLASQSYFLQISRIRLWDWL